MESIAGIFGSKKGWAFVESMMERQIERGATTAEHYRLHFEGGETRVDRTMDSFQHYLKWVGDHPGEAVPREVCQIRSDGHHANWLSQGCPSFENEVYDCPTCKTHSKPPAPWRAGEAD